MMILNQDGNFNIDDIREMLLSKSLLGQYEAN